MSLADLVKIVDTEPFDDQKPGTSGLRKKVVHFQQPNYIENFLQSFFSTLRSQNRLPENENRPYRIFVGGDGRFLMRRTIELAVKIAAANEIGEVFVALNGICSTPAASYMIRSLKLDAGLILTASHNPGGVDGDFGIKFNGSNGGPALENWTNAAYEHSKSLKTYRICEQLTFDYSSVGRFVMMDGQFVVHVVDCVRPYHQFMKTIFDFDAIREFLSGNEFRITGNALYGVMAPYIKRILVEDLGMSEEDAVKCECLEDFGGGHPDPNTTYAYELMRLMAEGKHDFGFAFDGDGDRNMIVGKSAEFVNPCDSLAIIASHLDSIEYYKGKITGFARSMPTSRAIDVVAQKMGLKCYETATGWKFFGNLMDAGLICLCGEESFGTGSNHIREKDGMWAVLAWLSILAHTKKSVAELLRELWSKNGRHFFSRYDFENHPAKQVGEMFAYLNELIGRKSELVGKSYGENNEYVIRDVFHYCYVDPVDGSRADNQGICFEFEKGERIVFRVSGTGSSNATVRIYLESYESDPAKAVETSHAKVIDPLVETAYKISRLSDFLGLNNPDVIT